MRSTVQYLKEHGPSPRRTESIDGIPSEPSPRDRMAGVWSFKITGGTGYLGKTRAVYYLKDTHEKTAVIRRWLSVNPKIISQNSRRTVSNHLNQHGTEWRDAVEVVLDDVFGRSFSEQVWGDYEFVCVDGGSISDRASDRDVLDQTVLMNINRVGEWLDLQGSDEATTTLLEEGIVE